MSVGDLKSSGTKVWLDSIDPFELEKYIPKGITGATSNPVIVANILKSGQHQAVIDQWKPKAANSEELLWLLTDHFVTETEKKFEKIYDESRGDDGYVSFELDPLIEDSGLSQAEQVDRYLTLALKWSAGHRNRLIKVPATESGIVAVEKIVAAGINVNVTLIFSERQHRQACESIAKGLKSRSDIKTAKNVLSVFVSRLDPYAVENCPKLSAGEGWVGVVNAAAIWRNNQDFWSNYPTPLAQEMIFASTGTKNPEDRATKYTDALSGSDIQTNPPSTLAAVEALGVQGLGLKSAIDDKIIEDVRNNLDQSKMEAQLMKEGIEKFCNPHRDLVKSF